MVAHEPELAGINRFIRERRTVRAFTPQQLSPELLIELLQAAADSQTLEPPEPPCRFLLIASPEGKAKTASLIMGAYAEQKAYRWVPGQISRLMANRMAQIPAYLLAVQRTDVDAPTQERHFAAICAMLQSFSLLAWERGIGLVWNTDGFLHKRTFRNGMGLQADERAVGMLYMGHFEKTPKPRPRTPAAKKLTYLP